MTAIQKLFRRNQTSDPIRESAALTTVHLLELNQKFEAFVREKIEALEPVVSSLEARSSHADDDWDDDVPPADGDFSQQSNEPPPLPEMKLVTQMTPPEPALSEPPPPSEPARAHQSLQDEGGVGMVFSFNMLAGDVPGADESATAPEAAPVQDGGADGDLPDLPDVDNDNDDEADDDMDDDEMLGVWDLTDDLSPGPVGEYE